MSVHYRRRSQEELHPNPPVYTDPTILLSTTKSRINHISRPHQNGLEPHVTPSELLVLLFAIGVLIALLGWLGWIMLEYCVTFVQEKREEYNYHRRLQRDEERAIQNAEDAVTFSGGSFDFVGLGKASIGALGGAIRGMMKRERHESERSRLFGGQGGNGTGGRYGYEGLFYRDQERMVDGASGDSFSTGHTVVHRDDCEGQCGLKSRRQSGEV